MTDKPAPVVPGEAAAKAVEQVYYKDDAPAALAKLQQDYINTLSAPNGQQKINNEVDRLVGDYDQSDNLLISLASQWATQQMDQRKTDTLSFNDLLPQQDAGMDPKSPQVQFDQLMASTLQNNWTDFANLTGQGVDGEVVDSKSVQLSRWTLQADQSDQESDRAIFNAPPIVAPPQSEVSQILADFGLA